MCPFLLSTLTSSGADLGKPCACCHSLWVRLCTNLVVSRRPWFLGVLYPFWLFHSFCILFHRVHWSGRDFMVTSLLGLGVPRSLSLCLVVWLCISISVPICCRRNLLWWWLSRTQIYEYSKISLEIMLLVSSFSRTVVFCFLLGPWPIQFQVLSHTSSNGCVLCLME